MSREIVKQYETPPSTFNPLEGHPDPEQLTLDSLRQGTLLAGREKPLTWELDEITSEGALHSYRAQAEIEALIHLAERGPVDIAIDEEQKSALRSLYSSETFDPEIVIRLDHLGYKGRPPLEHDVKAVEVYLGELLDESGLGELKEWVHFGMTSEDTNNLAYNYMLRDAANKVVVPSIARVADRLAHLAAIYADTPTLGTTHAQKASPTTVGKQFGYLLSNISQVVGELDDQRLTGKFSGAVGNHNPMSVLFPDFDYDAYAKDFVESQGFDYSSIENQRNNHLAVTEFLDTIQRLAVVGKDATDNVWLQILNGTLKQKLVAGEKGSSTMSHKINPWRLENAESLFEQTIGLSGRVSEGLVASRHERDLSDHDWQRAYGDILGRLVAGYNYFAIQLDRLAVNEEQTGKALAESAEVLSELIQTAGRVSGDPEAYDKVVAATQGKKLTLRDIRQITTESLPLDSDITRAVLQVRPETYVGVAGNKAREAVLGWHAIKGVALRGVLDESTSVDAVLFDFDNTLHFGDKDELFARLSSIAAQLGSGYSEEEIRTFGNRSDYLEMKKLMVEEHNRRFPSNRISEGDFQAANDAVTGSFDHLLTPAPRAAEILEKLRDSGKKTGLVTTRGNNSRDRLLEHHGLADSFDVIVGRGDAEQRKPHPQPIALALAKLGIDNYRRTLYVGDLQIDDVGAGNALGMKTALVNDTPLDPQGPVPTYHWTSLEPLARRYTR